MSQAANLTRPIRLVPALLLAALPCGPAIAGELTFGSAFRLEYNSNPDLDDGSDDAATRFFSRPSLRYVTETPVARMDLGATATMRRTLQGSDGNDGFTDPRVFFDYARESASASFSLSGSLRESNLAVTGDIDDFDEDTGTRRTAILDTGLQLREDAPFGIGLTAGRTRVTYDNDGGTQTDYTRSRFGLNARMDINEITRATLGLSYDVYQADGGSARDTWGLTASLIRERPLGDSRVTLGLNDTPGGTRSSLTFGHTVDTPLGTQGLRLGITRTASGDLSATGGFDLSYDLPNGALTATLDRRVTSGETDDAETTLTRAAAAWNHTLSPLASLRFDLSYAESDTGTATSANTEFGATYSRELTEDWALDVGLRHRQRVRDPGTDGASNTAFIELRRSLSLRF